MAAAAAAGAGIGSVSPIRTTAAFATGLSGNVSDGAAGMNSYFPLNKVSLLAGPFKDNQTRNTAYLTFLDADRLLRNFRLTFGISTTATATGGWEAPTSVLRGHTVGHWLSGLALTYANTGNTSCKAKGDYLVSALAACQARAAIQGFSAGYLSAYPESVFIDMENNLPATSNYAPYYVLHKIMQGLLDQYELAGNNQALSVLVGIADWVDYRTGNLTSTEMQQMLDTEYGGMSEVLANLGTITGDSKYFNAANRWWHKPDHGPPRLQLLAAGRGAREPSDPQVPRRCPPLGTVGNSEVLQHRKQFLGNRAGSPHIRPWRQQRWRTLLRG
jgi:DUF1680 family protein